MLSLLILLSSCCCESDVLWSHVDQFLIILTDIFFLLTNRFSPTQHSYRRWGLKSRSNNIQEDQIIFSILMAWPRRRARTWKYVTFTSLWARSRPSVTSPVLVRFPHWPHPPLPPPATAAVLWCGHGPAGVLLTSQVGAAVAWRLIYCKLTCCTHLRRDLRQLPPGDQSHGFTRR